MTTWTNPRVDLRLAFYEIEDDFQSVVSPIEEFFPLLGFSLTVDGFLSLDQDFDNPLTLVPTLVANDFLSIGLSTSPFNTIWTRLNPQ